jgi:hypothetical protein
MNPKLEEKNRTEHVNCSKDEDSEDSDQKTLRAAFSDDGDRENIEGKTMKMTIGPEDEEQGRGSSCASRTKSGTGEVGRGRCEGAGGPKLMPTTAGAPLSLHAQCREGSHRAEVPCGGNAEIPTSTNRRVGNTGGTLSQALGQGRTTGGEATRTLASAARTHRSTH